MYRISALVALLFVPLVCEAEVYRIFGFDLKNCKSWEFQTDIVDYKNPKFKSAEAKLISLGVDRGWKIFESIDQDNYEQNYGICRYASTGDSRPHKFECAVHGDFPLSGASFTAVKDMGQFSSSYMCAQGCETVNVKMLHDSTSEDTGNFELGASIKEFNALCPQSKRWKEQSGTDHDILS